MMNGFGYHGWGMGLSWIFGIVVFFGIILLLIQFFTKTSSSVEPEKTALDILKERYARGEISKEEFEEKKRDIS
jgi:putative membrane protein